MKTNLSSGAPETNGKSKKRKKLTPFVLLRAATTTVVFGIPLVISTTTMLGYGIYRAFKKLKSIT